MNFFDIQVFRIVGFISFCLLPLFFILWTIGYIFYYKKKFAFLLMPFSIIFSWIGLLNFYHQTHRHYFSYHVIPPSDYEFSLMNPFILIPFASIILAIITSIRIHHFKDKRFEFKRELPAPLFFIFIWILCYLYT